MSKLSEKQKIAQIISSSMNNRDLEDRFLTLLNEQKKDIIGKIQSSLNKQNSDYSRILNTLNEILYNT